MTPPAPNTTTRLETKIDSLSLDMAEIKTSLKDLSECYNRFQIEYEKRHATVENKADSAHVRLDAQAKEMDTLKKNIEEIEEAVRPLILQSKIMAWLAVVLGSSVIALIWGIITHTITISR